MKYVFMGSLIRSFLFSKSSDNFLSLISRVCIFGIGLGVAALVIVSSVINGFEGEFTRIIKEVNGELILYSQSSLIQNPDQVKKKSILFFLKPN